MPEHVEDEHIAATPAAHNAMRRYDPAVAIDPDSTLGRLVQAMAGSKAFAKVGPKVVPPMDRLASRLSGGRFMISRMMLPCAVVTTTGRKSGQPRTTPLASVPLDGDLYVVGSNFGKPHHPSWSWNLIETPAATVTYSGRDVPGHRAPAQRRGEGDHVAAPHLGVAAVRPVRRAQRPRPSRLPPRPGLTRSADHRLPVSLSRVLTSKPDRISCVGVRFVKGTRQRRRGSETNSACSARDSLTLNTRLSATPWTWSAAATKSSAEPPADSSSR